jgi:hypothetical protein
MSSVAISGNASGAGVLTIAAPNTASSYTLTLPTATTTLVGTDATQTLTNKTLTSPTIDGTPVMGASVITSGTVNAGGANPLASGTVVDFTSIPSWVKRITVMFSGVSLSATAHFLLQIGTGGTPTITGYVSSSLSIATAGAPNTTSTAGYVFYDGNATEALSGNIIISNVTGNTWVASGNLASTAGQVCVTVGAGTVALAGVLNILRITTTSTDTFDAGSINILYE